MYLSAVGSLISLGTNNTSGVGGVRPPRPPYAWELITPAHVGHEPRPTDLGTNNLLVS
jgi:hypothetical protein